MPNVRIKKLANDQFKGELLAVKKPAAEKPSPACFYTWEEYASRGDDRSQLRTGRSIRAARI